MLTVKERVLAAAWLSRFGTPLPVLGCEALAINILRDYGVYLSFGSAMNRVDKVEDIRRPREVQDGSTRRVGTAGEW